MAEEKQGSALMELVAGRIEGGRLQTRTGRPDTTTVQITWTDQDARMVTLAMPFLDAMYLLNVLKACQQELGFHMPEDPFAPRG